MCLCFEQEKRDREKLGGGNKDQFPGEVISVSTCVCVRERDREIDKERERYMGKCVCVCVFVRETQRESVCV